MKTISLVKQGGIKINEFNYDLIARDVEDLPRSCIPGEWVILENNKFNNYYLAFVNTIVELPNPQIRVVREITKEEQSSYVTSAENIIAQQEIIQLLNQSIDRRRYFKEMGPKSGARLVYGGQDFLPGLIVDEYLKIVMVQINTAGLDRFREVIVEELNKKCDGKKVILFDNETYRKSEFLPNYGKSNLDEDLEVLENDFKISVPSSVIQKIGYYYDHRNNRKRLENLLNEIQSPLKTGLDLFCYVGSWGLHMLRSGVAKVDFVDQGDFDSAVRINLENNGYGEKGNFFREDVFAFINKKLKDGCRYDVVCSDPPSFSKSIKTKNMAIQGYSKLNSKLIDLVAKNGILVVGSCTRYVSFEELGSTVTEAAIKKKRMVRLIDIGIQAPDHPMRDLKDKSNYIKYLAYVVE